MRLTLNDVFGWVYPYLRDEDILKMTRVNSDIRKYIYDIIKMNIIEVSPKILYTTQQDYVDKILANSDFVNRVDKYGVYSNNRNIYVIKNIRNPRDKYTSSVYYSCETDIAYCTSVPEYYGIKGFRIQFVTKHHVVKRSKYTNNNGHALQYIPTDPTLCKSLTSLFEDNNYELVLSSYTKNCYVNSKDALLGRVKFQVINKSNMDKFIKYADYGYVVKLPISYGIDKILRKLEVYKWCTRNVLDEWDSSSHYYFKSYLHSSSCPAYIVASSIKVRNSGIRVKAISSKSIILDDKIYNFPWRDAFYELIENILIS